MTFLNRLLLLAICLSILAVIWMVSSWFGNVPFKESFEQGQLDCFAAILRADAYGESPEKRGRAQELIADTVLRYKEQNPSTKFCEILENGLTIYPKNWVKSKLFWKRDATSIKNSPRYPGSPWNEALKRVREALERGADPSRCATHYVRVNPRYTFFTNELEAQVEIRKMQPDKIVEGVKTEFFCP